MTTTHRIAIVAILAAGTLLSTTAGAMPSTAGLARDTPIAISDWLQQPWLGALDLLGLASTSDGVNEDPPDLSSDDGANEDPPGRSTDGTNEDPPDHPSVS